jgi:hypothetical protein
MERADYWRAQYAEIAKNSERPAKSGLLRTLGLTVPGRSPKGLSIYPRYNLLDATLVEIERYVPADFSSLEDLRASLVASCEAAFGEETRPPDLVLSPDDLFSSVDDVPPFSKLGDEIKALGRNAKIVGGHESERNRRTKSRAMQEERDAFIQFVSTRTEADLSAVEAFPYRRTLGDDEIDRLLAMLKSRWGIDGEWYPLDRAPDADPPADAVAFRARPFFDKRLVGALQSMFAATGVERVFELREGGSSASYEIDLALLRPSYNFDEGYWFDRSADWVIYASQDGSVTVGGASVLASLKSVWHDWSDHLFTEVELGEQREVGPGVWSTSVAVEPPPGWSPPPS